MTSRSVKVSSCDMVFTGVYTTVHGILCDLKGFQK